jgi:hypothetical protein
MSSAFEFKDFILAYSGFQVNPDKPSCNYNLTYNCFNCEGNQQTYNDGYGKLQRKRDDIMMLLQVPKN